MSAAATCPTMSTLLNVRTLTLPDEPRELLWIISTRFVRKMCTMGATLMSKAATTEARP